MIKLRDESGFTMLVTTIAMAVVMLLAVVAVAAVNGDIQTSRRDLDQKQALEAAKAGVNDYAYHLTADSAYWAKCTNVEAPSAVNPYKSSTLSTPLPNRRTVPGTTGASYAIELIPATGKTACNPTTLATATESMLESGNELPGSFRIRSWGFAGKAKASIVATFKPPSFLDYVYFTQLETLDPVAYGFPNPSTELTEAYEQCSKTYDEGRYTKPFKVKQSNGSYQNEYCSVISFVTGDTIQGPFHTNDSIAVSGKPTFGRSSKDVVEVGGRSPGWYGSGSSPNFVGKFEAGAKILVPPSSNSKLATIASSQFRYTGQVMICLSAENMTVGKNGTCTGVYSGPIPENGVIYVSNGACGEVYSPFNATYPATSGCGNVYVKGNYSGQLTIAAQNNIIINGSLVRSGNGLLGLIANNFIRLYHPCSFTPREEERGEQGVNGAGSLTNPVVDAALLAIEHSIIVDHYDCGAQLGTLKVEGALAQKFRGPVGTSGNTGYLKDYVYDDRLQYQEPPSFIEPEQGGWILGRTTIG
jgi:type II secretory pathway pseudopilin PulG